MRAARHLQPGVLAHFYRHDALMLGYVTTTLHWTVAIAQFAAAIAAPAAAETGYPVAKV